MRLLLLGANGQLGSDILRANMQLPRPYEIVSWTRAKLDISNIGSIRAALNAEDFDMLINCTAYNNTDQGESNSALAFSINAFAVREMALACQDKKVCFVHVSTDYVFGGTNLRRPLTETDRPAPLSVYGASKLMGESLISALCEQVIILRVASLFGVMGSSGKGGNFIETMIKYGREKGKLRVVHDQQMTPTATADVAMMLFQLLQKGVKSEIYHAVNSGQATWYELAAKTIELCGISAEVTPVSSIEYPVVAMRPPYSVLDNSKISALIGPVPSWQQGLKNYLRDKKYC